MIKKRIGFIGAGQMATALGEGFIRAGLVSGAEVIASDPSSEARQRFARATGGQAVDDNAEVAGRTDVLFLAVKPQQMVRVAAELKGKLGPDLLLISIAAGIRLAVLAQGFGERVRLVRVMPNTPCLVGKGACGYCLGGTATPADGQLVGQLLSAVGLAVEVEEKLLDAVTGLSGSGPAFVYVIIEALSDGGVRMGLPRAVAIRLGRPNGPRRGPNGALDRRSSGRAQGSRRQPRRDDHRRTSGPRTGRTPRRIDGRRRGRHASFVGIGRR